MCSLEFTEKNEITVLSKVSILKKFVASVGDTIIEPELFIEDYRNWISVSGG